MNLGRNEIREAASHVGRFVDAVMREHKRGTYPDEPSITPALLEAIRQAFQSHRSRFRWEARVFTSHGRGAEERRIGADLGAILEIRSSDLHVRKGLLIQCKINRHDAFTSTDRRRLQEQCRKMLAYSPSSFVFLYDEPTVFVVPAVSVAGTPTEGPEAVNPDGLRGKTFRAFFEDHLSCFLGDPRLVGVIDNARAEGGIPHILHLTASMDD